MKNGIVFIAVLLWSAIGFSQSEKSDDFKRIKFGFNLGAQYSHLQSKEALPENAKIVNGVGFRLGLLMDYAITKAFIVSPKTEFAFNQSKVEFVNPDKTVNTYKVFPMSLEFMIHFMYKFGDGKLRPYILVGPNFKLPIEKKATKDTDFNTHSDFAIDFGIGLENAFKYYVYAPEIRYSFGLLNVNQNPAL